VSSWDRRAITPGEGSSRKEVLVPLALRHPEAPRHLSGPAASHQSNREARAVAIACDRVFAAEAMRWTKAPPFLYPALESAARKTCSKWRVPMTEARRFEGTGSYRSQR